MSRVIFVIEDEKDIRESLAEAIESEGYSTLTAPNGMDAILMFEDEARIPEKMPDLILLDLLMPRMNGATFLERARRNKRLAKIPVVLMTTDREAAQKATKYGAAGHLHKPLGLDELYSTIEKYCLH